MILASTSTIYGGTYLDYIKDEIKLLFICIILENM